MKDGNFLAWFLLISTFLIVGKAIGFLNISWIFAFGPLLLLFASFILIFILGLIMINKQNKNEQDGKNS